MGTQSISHRISHIFNSKWGQSVRESLTAYLFLFPALLIIFTFGLFPIAFAFFVSLHEWRLFPEEYVGLENYTDAIGNFAYVLFFWMAIGALIYGGALLWQIWQKQRRHLQAWVGILPGIASATAIALFINWFFKLLIPILDVPNRVNKVIRTTSARDIVDRAQFERQLFADEFLASFTFPGVYEAANQMLIGIAIALILGIIFMLLVQIQNRANLLMRFTVAFLMVIAAGYIMRLTLVQIELAFAEAREDGVSLPLWSQILLISSGAGLLLLAYVSWIKAQQAESNRRFLLMLFASIVLMVGGYILVAEIPRVFIEMDKDLRRAFWVTVMYVIGTVPLQLGLGLVLAYLLFHQKFGKSFFRIIYFLPYITPFAATAVIFTTIFSSKPDSPANQLLNLLGIEDQLWRQETTPINVMLFGESIPGWLEGPSLALIVIMIWTTWTYVGYDTVIFLAGLGNIPSELYEAARIDGANSWHLFRHITLPLLSPTTFFLSLVAIIGTFQAFTQIWIMRLPGYTDAVDTVGVQIYEEITKTRPEYGYGAAMAFVLFFVIMIITFVQNRYAGRKVFYG